MNDFTSLLKQIDDIVIDNNRSKLNLKMRLIQNCMDYAVEKGLSDTEILETLKRVNWLTYEVGGNKAFESTNIELPLVIKACEMAENKLNHRKKDLLPFLQLKL